MSMDNEYISTFNPNKINFVERNSLICSPFLRADCIRESRASPYGQQERFVLQYTGDFQYPILLFQANHQQEGGHRVDWCVILIEEAKILIGKPDEISSRKLCLLFQAKNRTILKIE